MRVCVCVRGWQAHLDRSVSVALAWAWVVPRQWRDACRVPRALWVDAPCYGTSGTSAPHRICTAFPSFSRFECGWDIAGRSGCQCHLDERTRSHQLLLHIQVTHTREHDKTGPCVVVRGSNTSRSPTDHRCPSAAAPSPTPSPTARGKFGLHFIQPKQL